MQPYIETADYTAKSVVVFGRQVPNEDIHVKDSFFGFRYLGWHFAKMCQNRTVG